MNYRLLFNTLIHLRPTQVFYQVYYRLHKAKYVAMEAPCVGEKPATFKTEPIARWRCVEGKVFTFLNLEHEFAGWNFTENGMLWAYNQNYMDWLNQEGYSVNSEEGASWIDKFIEDVCKKEEGRGKMCVGLDPYPIALRSINWIKFFMLYPDTATKERKDSLYSQLRLLEKKLEYHLLANHLLEDAYALYIGAVYFGDERLLKKAKKLLLGQLEEQILPDGGHYEQSVMYHCILLDRLLDCINIGECCDVNSVELRKYAVRMVGWQKSMCYNDGSFPFFNDAAEGIAPRPKDIIDYARRLDIESEATELGISGYRKLANAQMEAFVDVGNITATYQPGHTHADTFNYELRIDGKPFVVDTGISTYNKTERRQYERGTMAHNCVVPVGCGDSSEVWGGFRVGRRATTQLIMDNGQWIIEAAHDGYGKACKRRFEMKEDAFVVEDWYDGEAVSYIHLAEGADEKRIAVEGATSIEIKEERYSTEYNRFRPCKVMAIHFNGKLKYEIR